MTAPVLPMKVTLHHTDGRNALFLVTLWAASFGRRGCVTLTRWWGKIGGHLQSLVEDFENVNEALARFEQLIAEKRNRGYWVKESLGDRAVNASHGADVEPGAVLETGCWIGHECRIRTGAVIGRAASIANGVDIPEYSLIGHQAQIACKDIDGPLVTGPRVRVGADAYTRGRLLDWGSFASASVIVHAQGVVEVYVGRGCGVDWKAFKVTGRASLEAIPGCMPDDVKHVGELLAATMHEDRLRHGGAAFRAAMATPGVAEWIQRWLTSSGSMAPMELEASLSGGGWCAAVPAGGYF